MISGNICIWCIAWLNFLWVPLANKIKEDLGVNIYGICSTKKDLNFFKSLDQEGSFENFVSTDHFIEEYTSDDFSSNDAVEIARENEKRYNFLYVDILQTDRHLGRGFVAGAPYFPRSELSKHATYLRSINVINKIILFWEKYFKDQKIKIMIGAPGGLIGKTACVIARGNGIAIRTIAWAKYLDFFYWATDEYLSFPGLKEKFRNTERIQDLQEIIIDLPKGEIAARKKTLKRERFVFVFKDALRQILIRNYQKIRHLEGPSKYFLSSELKFIFRTYFEFLNLRKIKLFKFEDLKNERYFFYPLHLEPEIALSVLSPEFNEQLALIEFMAKNLPANYKLAVKEHIYSIGRRPKEFYSIIAEIPNVLLVDYREHALTIMENCVAMVVISSTAGFEAAIKGIPVISFGKHNIFNFLDHVYSVESWIDLRNVILEICDKYNNREASFLRKRAGLNFLNTMIDLSMDIPGMKLAPKGFEIKLEYLNLLVQRLYESLENFQ
ncbi:MAG: hypothetical protein JRI72_03050 [Deltaproteobacteria bacterium]|nr:hypothetical protein [Deltaproteobacteria bacterium]